MKFCIKNYKRFQRLTFRRNENLHSFGNMSIFLLPENVIETKQVISDNVVIQKII